MESGELNQSLPRATITQTLSDGNNHETLPEGVLSVQFDLPSIEPETIRGRAVVVWASASVAGLRFLYLEPPCRAGFQAWLDSMEAQLQFRESAHDSRATAKETGRRYFCAQSRREVHRAPTSDSIPRRTTESCSHAKNCAEDDHVTFTSSCFGLVLRERKVS